MGLLEIYMDEVKRRLPEKSGKDIETKIRNSIASMLPDNYADEDVKKVLQTLGSPASLALKYRFGHPLYLIGPRYFERYTQFLIIAAAFALLIVLFSTLVNSMIERYNDVTLVGFIVRFFAEWFSSSFNALAHVFLWVTIGFVILERTGVSLDGIPFKRKPWNPDVLLSEKHVSAKRSISRVEVIFSLIWTVLWLVIVFHASELLGWYDQEGSGIEEFKLAAPLFNQDVLMSYFPLMVGIAFIAFGLACYKLVVSHWTFNLAVFNLIYQFLFVVLMCIMISDLKLFNPAFLSRMAGVLDIGESTFKANWHKLIWGGALITIVFTIIDIAKGFLQWKKGISQKEEGL